MFVTPGVKLSEVTEQRVGVLVSFYHKHVSFVLVVIVALVTDWVVFGC